jgi:VCBS repeat-containing protein
LIHTPGESFEARESAAVSVHADTGVVTIPDAHLLFTADFQRKGSDLVLTGDDGHKILVTDYFRHEKQPDLVSPEGALLSASVVELLAGSAAPGQYAQATAPAAQQPVGRVETVSGSATVVRNGVAVDLNVGDLVFQGDVVQTRSDSTLGIGFADGSAFSLKENARMALNEFVYDPNSTSNSALINLVQGTVSFIASQVAKTGNMRVETPTATLGIRGTFVTVDVSSVDGHTVASLGLETNLTTGEQFAGAFTLTNRITGNQVNVSQVNSMFSVSPTGTIGESAKPPEMHAIEGQSFQALHAIAAATAAGMGTAPTGPNQFLNDPNSPSGPKGGDPAPSGPAPGGSSGANTAPTNTSPADNQQTTATTTTTTSNTPPANAGPTNIPTNTNQTNTLPVLSQTNTLPDIKSTVVTTDTTKTDTHQTETPTSQPTTNNPTTITTASATGSFSELPNHTNDTTDVDQASGVIAFADPNLSDTHTVTQGAPTFTWSGGSLSSPQKAALAAAGSLQLTTTDSTSSGAGLVAWTYKITDNALDFLAAGQTLTVTYNVTIDDHHGGSVTQPVTVTITGTNDAPAITDGDTTGSVTENDNNHNQAHGQLNAIDPDFGATQTWTVVSGTASTNANYHFSADSFSITKANGAIVVLQDNFNSPLSSTTYSINGGFDVAGGKLLVDSSNAVPFIGVGTNDPIIGQTAVVRTNVDDTNSTAGLKEATQFTITSVFDLVFPDSPVEAYGIRATDRLLNDVVNPTSTTLAQAGDDTFELVVRQNLSGQDVVSLRQLNFATNTTTNLESIILAPPVGADQIRLTLAHTAGSTDLVPSFQYLSNGSVIGTAPSFSQVAPIFGTAPGSVDTENWTLAGIVSYAPAKTDSILSGTYGTLDINQAGAWTYTLDNSRPATQSLFQGQHATDSFTVQVTDQYGAFDTKTINIDVTGANDAPTPVADIVAVNEDGTASAATRSAGVLGNDTDPDTGETSTLVVSSILAGTSGTATALSEGTASVNGTYGTLTIHSNGTYSYTPNNAAAEALPQGSPATDLFTYTAKDVHGATATSTLTFNITGQNDAPVAVADVAAVTEDSESNPVSGNVLTNDTDVDTGDSHSVTAVNGSSSNVGQNVCGTYGTLHLNADGSYTYTLDNSKPSVQALADGQQVTDVFTYTNSDNHGGSNSSTLTVTVTGADDSPTAEPVEVSVDTENDTNVMIILDVSGSMNSNSGVPGHTTRLEAAIAAINELLDQYDSLGDVKVQIVKFSTGAEQVGANWMSVTQAKAAIADLTANGSTFYDEALTEAMNIFGNAGKLSGSNTQNVSYFLSDGVPTENHAVEPSQKTSWESFLTTNNVVSFALGISDSPTTTDLDPIAFDPAPGDTQLADTPIIVSDLNDLADTLVTTASSTSGSLLSGANSFGGDGGGYVKSITVDGVTYTFDPTANSITTSGGGGSYTYTAATHTLTVDTDTGASGGELAMVMTTGAFTFQPSTGFSSESVGFVLADGDGDTASSTLELTSTTLPAGVAGSPINLGLSDPAGHVGPVTVTIAGVPAGWTLNRGTNDGHGNWTIPASSVAALSITSPDHYAGAMAFKATMSWTNADHSSGSVTFTDNVEVFAPGAPIVACSDDDHLTGSSGSNLFVFAQPIGHDSIYSFDASEDQIDLIGFAGFTNFNDVQRHLAEDSAGNAVIALGTGQSIALIGVAASSLTAGNFVFDQTPVLNNAGTMTIGNGALLPLTGIINNAGTIALDSAGSETHLQLIQYGIALHGGGQLVLSDSGENFISGTVPSVTLTNVDNTISGAGQLGAGQMTLVNDGTIVATGFHALVIDTGANVVTNAGTLEATGSGGLMVNSDVANSGLIWAHGGNITINGAVTGPGSAMIDGTATLGFGAASSAHITFAADAAGTLTLKDAADFTGTISGFSSNDQIDLTNINYSIASVSNATYSSSTNITTLVITDGTSTDAIKLVGNYTINTAWHFSGDGHGGTLLTDSDVAQTVTAALTGQGGSADQFTFQNDSQGSTLAGSTLVASADPSATDAATLDPTSTSSNDHQPTAPATTLADAGPASNVAANSQPPAADSTSTDQQAGATTQTALASPAATGPNGGDTFVFAANFGHETIANFHPDTDVIEIDHTVFADFQALLAAAHDDANGNAVIAANPNDSITVKNVTVAQLVQHQSDFHFT